jgi:hypothetical protein
MLATVFSIIIAMTSCNKENIKVNEVLIKQQDLIDSLFNVFNFVGFNIDTCVEGEDMKIVRPEEERFLISRMRLKDLIYFIPVHTKKYGCGMVLAMRDDRDRDIDSNSNVLSTLVGTNINTNHHPEWYDRLHVHILDHYNDSTFVTTNDAIDPNNPPVNCIRTLDINIAFSFIISSFSAKKDVYVERMPDGWYLFNGYCKRNKE